MDAVLGRTHDPVWICIKSQAETLLPLKMYVKYFQKFRYIYYYFPLKFVVNILFQMFRNWDLDIVIESGFWCLP